MPLYLGAWPFGSPSLIITSPAMAIHACQDLNLDKSQLLEHFFQPFAGGNNLFAMNVHEWKSLRSIFNAEFNASYVLAEMDLVEVIREHAHTGDTFSLEKFLLNFVMNVIGSMSLGSKFHS